MITPRFWETKTLEDMNPDEWESLCDGCAQCCLVKLEDEDTGDIAYTRVVCHLLDIDRCRCTQYPRRSELVPTCLMLTPALVRELTWLPETCAYRLVRDGEPLPSWHPLLTGNPGSAIHGDASVATWAVSETTVPEEDLEEYVIRWVE